MYEKYDSALFGPKGSARSYNILAQFIATYGAMVENGASDKLQALANLHKHMATTLQAQIKINANN